MQYKDLHDVISFSGFSFSDYVNGEKKILTPRLHEKGFYAIKWQMGEYDSFGPLTRICICKRGNKIHHFIYG